VADVSDAEEWGFLLMAGAGTYNLVFLRLSTNLYTSSSSSAYSYSSALAFAVAILRVGGTNKPKAVDFN